MSAFLYWLEEAFVLLGCIVLVSAGIAFSILPVFI